MLNGTFSNISVALVVEEAEVPWEKHRPWAATGKRYHLRCESSAPFFVIYKAGHEPTRICDKLVRVVR